MGEEVKMKAVPTEKVKKEKKLSYEELETVARQLSAQVEYMKNQSRSFDLTLKRLEYLFKVVNSPANVFPEDFKQMCVNEIVEIMSPEQEETEEK